MKCVAYETILDTIYVSLEAWEVGRLSKLTFAERLVTKITKPHCGEGESAGGLMFSRKDSK